MWGTITGRSNYLKGPWAVFRDTRDYSKVDNGECFPIFRPFTCCSDLISKQHNIITAEVFGLRLHLEP